MQIYKYTIRTLMLEVGLSYERSYRLMEKMREKGLVKDFGLTRIGAKNAKVYGFTIMPHDYLEEERSKKKSSAPPPTFYNNPFNLYGAIDARYNP